MNGIQAAWDTYTPTWTSSGTTPAIGNGTLNGKWIRLGRTVTYRIQLTVGSTTTFGTGNYIWAIPTAAHADYSATMHMGNGLGFDTSAAAVSPLTAIWFTSTTIYATTHAATTVAQ